MNQTLDRIKVADTDSPIAVFRAEGGLFESLFGNTVETQRRISRGDRTYIGSYCKEDFLVALLHLNPKKP